jgi:hypothetical protein
MAKNKGSARNARRDKDGLRAKAKSGSRVPQDGRAGLPEPNERPNADALRASVGRGTLAEHALDSITAAMNELERLYGEVAALGKSLVLAREQLAEQESELEAAQESRSLRSLSAGAELPRQTGAANRGLRPDEGPRRP